MTALAGAGDCIATVNMYFAIFLKSDYFKRILISRILRYHTQNYASVVFISAVRVHTVHNSKGSLNLPMANLVP